MCVRNRWLGPVLFVVHLLAISSLQGKGQLATPDGRAPWRNPDGSLRLALEFGGGYSAAAGATRRDQGRGWNFVMGSGYNLNRRLGVMGEYSFNDFRVPQSEVNSLFNVPSYYTSPVILGGVHIWSVTAEPVFHLYNRERAGGYLIGGGGFYRKLVSFRTPAGSPYSGSCGNQLCGATATYYHVSNNAPGANLGIGFAWRLLENSNVKVYAEARYTWIDNQAAPSNPSSIANKKTDYFSITGGVRW